MPDDRAAAPAAALRAGAPAHADPSARCVGRDGRAARPPHRRWSPRRCWRRPRWSASCSACCYRPGTGTPPRIRPPRIRPHRTGPHRPPPRRPATPLPGGARTPGPHAAAEPARCDRGRRHAGPGAVLDQVRQRARPHPRHHGDRRRGARRRGLVLRAATGQPGYALEGHLRPQGYWPAHALGACQRRRAGGSPPVRGTCSTNGLTLDFRTGTGEHRDRRRPHAPADLVTDGRVVARYPVSLGSPGTPTRRGTKVVMSKGDSICLTRPRVPRVRHQVHPAADR